ncbi:hypothetical protein [Variovorax paradoxus]|uniref:hypothetical protein n=1 Tax=Variovorax paradoxus TaxID=34073 RepID=UPI003ECF79D1
MASVVDTSVKNFNSTMSGMPPYNGVAGSTIALLDAVLVNGVDLKNANSLVVAGGVATLAFTGAHSAQLDSVILVSGSSIAALNGEQKVTAVGAGIVRFATAAADGAASGSITFKMAPAGWEKVYSGPNKAVYRSLDPASTKMLLRVDDSAAQWARVVGYESMSDIDTGAGLFPTTAQLAGGGYWAKSMIASAAAVPWVIHADSRIFYFTPQYGIPNNASYQGGVTRFFGDFIAYKPGGDGYGCVLSYSVNSAIQLMTDGHLFGGAGTGNATPRPITGLGSAQLNSLLPFTGIATATSGADGYLGTFPSPVDGSLQLSRKFISASGGIARGEFPGAFHGPQSILFDSFKQLDKIPGAGPLAGRTLQAVNAQYATVGINSSASATTNCGTGFFDLTGPWR